MPDMVSLVARALIGKFGPAAEALAGLTAGESGFFRRRIVKSFLPSLLGANVPGARALRMFRQLGLGIRTQDFYSTVRSLENRSAIQKVAGDARISAELYTPTSESYPDPLTAKVKVFYRDTATGRYASTYVNVGVFGGETNDEITQRAMENIEGYWAAGRAQYFDEIFSLSVEEILEREV